MPEPIRLEKKTGGRRVLHAAVTLPVNKEEIFPFFADAANLERITPPLLNFRILSPQPIEMREGALIDYRIRIRGVPVTWTTRIAAWEPSTRFIDEQIKGPYRTWIHEHTFENTPHGCQCRDRVEYLAPGGEWVSRWFVDHDVVEIFRYRHRILERLFASAPP